MLPTHEHDLERSEARIPVQTFLNAYLNKA